MEESADATGQTIEDFGNQWQQFQRNEGYYASEALLQDIFCGLYDSAALQGASVADIGSGSGRIVRMLLACGVKRVYAVEPSSAFKVLKENTKEFAEKITYINGRGEELPAELELDAVISLGVLHHIPDPDPVVRAAWNALRPGGKIVIWLYGKEGNRLYLFFAEPLRKITRILPKPLRTILTGLLYPPLLAYAYLCSVLRLPLWRYMRNHILQLDHYARFLTIYDQLNPAYAKYYTQKEARELLEKQNFKNVKLANRHGYSWTVIGEK